MLLGFQKEKNTIQKEFRHSQKIKLWSHNLRQHPMREERVPKPTERKKEGGGNRDTSINFISPILSPNEESALGREYTRCFAILLCLRQKKWQIEGWQYYHSYKLFIAVLTHYGGTAKLTYCSFRELSFKCGQSDRKSVSCPQLV